MQVEIDARNWPVRLKTGTLKRHGFHAILMLALLFAIYSNSFDDSWHFDDYLNIVNNGAVHIRSLTWVELEKAMHGISDSGRWSRPVSYATFALNYYFHGLDVSGYHAVNLIIHCLTAFFLYLFILSTLRLPIFQGRYEHRAESIALLSTVLWAVNPVQTSAVTYIVQRMAGLAALFYILSMYLFLKGRVANRAGFQWVCYLLSFLAGVLSIGSKENAATLPVSLWLFDLILIRGMGPEAVKKSLKYGVAALLVILGTGFLFFADIPSLIGDFSIRPFTAWERLITEPRIMLFYVSLLLYPVTQRLTLVHDFEVSKSLIDPWTTGAAILVIAAVLILAVMKARKWPLLSYCVIFFFLNHAIEGSFLSLELVFEHRNYLPSMLLFVPMSLLFLEMLGRVISRKALFLLLTLAMSLFIMLMGMTVYIQNDIWRTEISLWRDNAEKAPRVHHVQQNLATAYFVAGRLPEAFAAMNEALKSYASADVTKKARTQGLLGEYHFVNGDDGRALFHYREGLRLDTKLHLNHQRIAEILLKREGPLDDAAESVGKAIALKGNVAAYRLTHARMLMKQGLRDRAKEEVKKALFLDPDSAAAFERMSEIMKAEGREQAARHFAEVAAVRRQ